MFEYPPNDTVPELDARIGVPCGHAISMPVWYDFTPENGSRRGPNIEVKRNFAAIGRLKSSPSAFCNADDSSFAPGMKSCCPALSSAASSYFTSSRSSIVTLYFAEIPVSEFPGFTV